MTTHLTNQDTFGGQRSLRHLQALAAVGAVRPFAKGVSVECDEVDFVIRVSTADDELGCETQWQVTVREPKPGLNTWWGTWRRTFAVPEQEVGPLIADEVSNALTRVQTMLEDRTTGAVQQFLIQGS